MDIYFEGSLLSCIYLQAQLFHLGSTSSRNSNYLYISINREPGLAFQAVLGTLQKTQLFSDSKRTTLIMHFRTPRLDIFHNPNSYNEVG